jgi:hypothetical protein
MKRLWYLLVVLSAVACLFACEKESNYRFRDEELIGDDETTEDTIGMDRYPTDGSLAFYETFQSWKRDGYVNQVKNDCETDLMTSTIIMYRPGAPLKVTYSGFQVSYTLQDYAVNPECGNKAGTSTATSEVSLGYVALQSEIYYECGGHNSDALMTLSELPSVSAISFSVSYGGDVDYVGGLSLWIKADGEDSFTRIGDYKPENPLLGAVFYVTINKKNVQLKFTPAISDKGIGVNDGVQANRSVRIHDLYVWSMNES